MTLQEKTSAIVGALEDRKAEDIRTYDVRGVSGLCDAFVVATGAAAPHLKALLGAARAAMKDAGETPCRTSGDTGTGWGVADFGDVVVHVFSPEARAYYAREKLWPNAPSVV